jgi:hypothetical protein
MSWQYDGKQYILILSKSQAQRFQQAKIGSGKRQIFLK